MRGVKKMTRINAKRKVLKMEWGETSCQRTGSKDN
jgi:hypothetical protein